MGHVAVKHGHVVPLGLQGFGHRHGDRLGAGKNDHPLLGFRLQHPAEGLQFLGCIHREVTLADAAGIVALLADCDLGGIVEVLPRDAANFGRHGGREQHHLALLGQLAEHPFDIVDEAHAQHLIGLIEHQGAQAGEIQGALAHVVHHPAGGTNHHLDAALEPGDLVAEIGTAIHGQHPQVGHLGGEGVEGFGHLDRQFPGGGEHQHLGGALVGVDRRQQGQGEGGRFARTRLGLTNQVPAQEELRDGRLLDRRGLLVANVNQGLQQFRGEAEIGKTVLRFGVAVL